MGLAQGIEFMLTNTELADAMAQKAKEWVRAHRSIGVTVSALIGLYDALMDSKEPPRIP